jgi:S-adenosylmethionine-dependent methyltransferase
MLEERPANKMKVNADSERFRSGAEKYASYLGTPEGRLRVDLAFANLQEFLPRKTRSLHALDIGSGTGAIAVRLAQIGLHVAMLDSSLPMLDLAERAAQEAGVTDKIALKHGDVSQLPDLFPPRSFDVVLCHNVLEYVENPCVALTAAAGTLRDSSSIISILVRNQAGEALKAAIQAGDLELAERNLTVEWGQESLWGGQVRLFTPDGLEAMLKTSSLAVTVKRGVRAVSDYLPPKIDRTAEYGRIFELERKLGMRAEFAAIARYTQYLAHCPSFGRG